MATRRDSEPAEEPKLEIAEGTSPVTEDVKSESVPTTEEPASPPPEQTTTEPAAETPAPSPFAPVLDHAKQLGVKFDNEDPTQVVNQLLMAHLDRERVAQQREYAEKYQQHGPQFESWLAEQAKAKQPEKPKTIFERKPEFDTRWLSMVEQDPQTGRIKAKAGFPAEIAQKVEAYQAWAQEMEWATRNDLPGLVNPLIQEQVSKQVQQIQRQIQVQTESKAFLDANRDWMFANDGKQYQLDAKGQYVPSPAGQRFWGHVQRMKQAGVQNPLEAYHMAMELVSGELAMQSLQSGQTAVNDAQRKAELLKEQAAKGASRGGAGQVKKPGVADSSGEGLTLRERILRDWRADGGTDEDLREQMRGKHVA